jgi:hypothetical protein
VVGFATSSSRIVSSHNSLRKFSDQKKSLIHRFHK